MWVGKGGKCIHVHVVGGEGEEWWSEMGRRMEYE